MTELMVRLIKDGIPYAELRLQSGMALVHYFYNGDDEWEKTDIDELMCIIDSFDMGIKVGEGWKFSGDKLWVDGIVSSPLTNKVVSS